MTTGGVSCSCAFAGIFWMRRATSNPSTTRPKAATVGVGRQVILRPAIQKRYIELQEPSLHDQRTDLVRVLDAIDDFDLVVEPVVLATLGRDLRAGVTP
jgi:hypothetical protein